MANVDKYYKLKTNNDSLFHTEPNEEIIDEENRWEEITEEEYNARLEIRELKAELRATDYVVIKIAEAATSEQQAALRAEYAEVIAHRIEVRAQINELEEGL